MVKTEPCRLNINTYSMCIKDLNRHGYEPAWIMRGLNTKCQLENKQLENVYFLSSYFTMSSHLCFHNEEKKK